MTDINNSKPSLQIAEADPAEGFSSRLRLLLGSESVRSFAKAVNIGQTTLQQYLHGSIPSLDRAALIAAHKGVSLKWLATGEGPMSEDPILGTGTFLTPFIQGGDDLTLVPRLDVQAAAGNGAVNYSEEAAGFMAFQAAWLLEHGINPRFARILTATGDSMEPTIRDGDLLLVDTSIDQLVNHGIYVIIYSGLLLVKRVTKRLDGSVLIRSDNRAAYDDEIITAEHAVDLVIAGRVRWAGRTL